MLRHGRARAAPVHAPTRALIPRRGHTVPAHKTHTGRPPGPPRRGKMAAVPGDRGALGELKLNNPGDWG